MAFGGAKADGGRLRAEINITPLVDVVLVLLIIFMVVTPTLLKEMAVTVPDPSEVHLAVLKSPDQLVLSISREGKIAVNREPILESQLVPRIHELMAKRTDGNKLLFFDIDDDANYGESMHILDLCRGAGVRSFGMLKLPSAL